MHIAPGHKAFDACEAALADFRERHVMHEGVVVSDQTVKAWEQGIKPPCGSALRLPQIAETRPDVFTAQATALTMA